MFPGSTDVGERRADAGADRLHRQRDAAGFGEVEALGKEREVLLESRSPIGSFRRRSTTRVAPRLAARRKWLEGGERRSGLVERTAATRLSADTAANFSPSGARPCWMRPRSHVCLIESSKPSTPSHASHSAIASWRSESHSG